MSSLAIFNKSGEIKKSEELGQVVTCKFILYSTLQTFKKKIIPLWRLNKQILSTHILPAHITALTEII